MRASGRGWLAIVVAALAIVGATAAEREGPKAPPPAEPGTAVSSVWLCPHGGGPRWHGTIAIANPGDAPVEARLRALGDGASAAAGVVDVPAHGEVLRDVPADARAASTAVEIFGGWAGVAWLVRAGGNESGLGAEPCTADPGGSWSVVDATTTRDATSYLIVMNPFAADAVIDVALFLPDKPPVRSAAWTDLPVRAGHSVALNLRAALGKSIVGAQVTATRGRVAVGSLVVGRHGGVRSVLAAPAAAPRWILPVAGSPGGGEVSLLVPGDTGVRFSGTLLSDSPQQTAGNLTGVNQGGTSTVSAGVTTSGASAVVLQVDAPGVVNAGFRATGTGDDDQAATGGTTTPASAWVVMPTAIGGSPKPSLVLVNDGEAVVTVTLRLLPEGGSEVGDEVTVAIPAHSATAAPKPFLTADPTAAVLATGDGAFVALGAGTSGPRGTGWYAMSLGVPLPTTGP